MGEPHTGTFDSFATDLATANAVIWRICGQRFQVTAHQGWSKPRSNYRFPSGHEFSILRSCRHVTLSSVPGACCGGVVI